ncbi:hypothetical protein [Tenacibaculum sp. C7A-26P2]|uniref:hypothetical protein n=1 Tax=Tenacibaculum sp. C7A-26P2 TaxID=3447504 RepID=UPI003F860732
MKVIVFIISFLFLNNLTSQNISYKIKNLSLNTKDSEIAPTFYKNNTLVFARPIANNSNKRLKFFNLFKTDETNLLYSNSTKKVIPFSNEINTFFHESNAVFTKDYNTIYFTKTNAKKRRPGKKDSEGSVVLKIYTANYINGKWKNIRELPFNSDNYSIGHPALSNDDKKLFFTSNMPGTHGESDIFVVDILDNNKYSTPKNLGRQINSSKKEMFPFIDENNNLYFSSNNNNEDLDIYCSKFKDGTYEKPHKLDSPINSNADDFGFIKKRNQNKGYFSSNRYGGKGGDDIYYFAQNNFTSRPKPNSD